MPLVGLFGGFAGFGMTAAGGDFESIATVTVGSGGAANIEFTSIPGTYQHLQVRVLAKNTSTGEDDLQVIINSDTGSNYARHHLRGTGAAAQAGGVASIAYTLAATNWLSPTAQTNVFSAAVLDVLDYASTSKATTLRSLFGRDSNGSGVVGISSGLWTSTSAVTTVKLQPSVGTFAQHSTAALYGVKA